MTSRSSVNQTAVRPRKGAQRRVYIELEEHIARIVDRGARDLGESRSSFIGRLLQATFPGLCSEIEVTRQLR
ncbi:MAG: hypothetical protein IPK60_02025 [Sandaracinaceae bacterium]|nr:hypothetical protein [Sandaracinaceae bacterium]